MATLRIAVWNANGLNQRKEEISLFLRTCNTDVLLVSETHVTDRSRINIPHYPIYHTPHPDKKAHGGTEAIVRRNLKHHLGTAYSEEHIQATSIVLEDQMGEITVTAVYSPTKQHKNHRIRTILPNFGTPLYCRRRLQRKKHVLGRQNNYNQRARTPQRHAET